MSLAGQVRRVCVFYSRHGFVATLLRAKTALTHRLFYNRMVVFYCDLPAVVVAPTRGAKKVDLSRLSEYSELQEQDFGALTSFWNPKQAQRDIADRFSKGASLWLLKSEGVLAGFGWTIRGRTITPYYFPIGQNDIQLFDFYVFPKFRGRAFHWLLTNYILRTLAKEGGQRAFADTGEWNQAQLASFRLTNFQRLGLARSRRVFGHTFISWVGTQEPMPERSKHGAAALTGRAAD